jgi:hypothetical protein
VGRGSFFPQRDLESNIKDENTVALRRRKQRGYDC